MSLIMNCLTYLYYSIPFLFWLHTLYWLHCILYFFFSHMDEKNLSKKRFSFYAWISLVSLSKTIWLMHGTHFWTLCSFSLIYLSMFSSLPHHLNYCRFIRSSWSQRLDLLTLVIFKVVLIIFCFLLFLIH